MSDINVMVDLETLSQRNDAAIVSIGAVKFTQDKIIDEFYINIDPLSNKEYNFHIDPNTINWWKDQKPEAWKSLKTNRIGLKDALVKFNEWYGDTNLQTWSCGSDFDLVIMNNAYQATQIKEPWNYWDKMCFRTFKKLFKIDMEVNGVNHNALDDARNQASYIIEVFKRK